MMQDFMKGGEWGKEVWVRLQTVSNNELHSGSESKEDTNHYNPLNVHGVT